MFSMEDILQLYTHVVSEEIIKKRISELDILSSLQLMLGIYLQKSDINKVPYFNSVAFRCAYLHMYAPINTAIVKSTMSKILELQVFDKTFDSRIFRMCSLGGGPGIDVIGVLSALHYTKSSYVRSIVTIVDCIGQWKSSFKSITEEFKKRDYGSVGRRFTRDALLWNYIEGDLVNTVDHRVLNAISTSTLLVMNHFISILKKKEIEKMIKKVFKAMKPGSFVLVIDEDSEKWTQIVLDAARHHHMVMIYGPILNEMYSFEELKSTRFGHTSCYQAAVSIFLLKKELFQQESSTNGSKTHKKRIKKSDNGRNLYSSGTGTLSHSVLKNLPLCMVFEDDFQTPFNSNSVSPVSWTSFNSDSESDTAYEKNDNVANVCQQENFRMSPVSNISTSIIIQIPDDFDRELGGRSRMCGPMCSLS